MLKEIQKQEVIWDIDPFQEFKNDINKFKLLTREEEISLGRQYIFGKKCKSILNTCLSNNLSFDRFLLEGIQNGIDARERMINSNQKLVMKLAVFFSGFTEEGLKIRDDIVHNFFSGCEGLIKAVEAFDPERGNKFSTYATRKIYKAITENIRWKVIYAPRWVRLKVIKYLKLCENYIHENSETPSDEYILEKLKITQGTLDLIRTSYASNSSMSLDYVSDEEEGGDGKIDDFSIRDYFSEYSENIYSSVNPTEDYALEKVSLQELDAEIFKALEGMLHDRLNMMIFTHIFILGDNMTQNDIAKECNVSLAVVSTRKVKLTKLLAKDKDFVSFCIDYLGLRDYKNT